MTLQIDQIWPKYTRWSAPERIDPKQYGLSGEEAISKAADMYALGMTIYEMTSSLVPFKHLHSAHVGMAVLNGERPELPGDISVRRGLVPKLWLFVQQCWRDDRVNRPEISELHQLIQLDGDLRTPPDIVSNGAMLQVEQFRLDNASPACTAKRCIVAKLRKDWTAQIDRWVSQCSTNDVESAGEASQRQLRTLLHVHPNECCCPSADQNDHMVLTLWKKEADKIMINFYQHSLRELLNAEQDTQINLLRQGNDLPLLRKVVQESARDVQMRLLSMVEYLIRVLHRAPLRSIEGRESIFRGLECLLPVDQFPNAFEGLVGLENGQSWNLQTARGIKCMGRWEGQLVAVRWLWTSSVIRRGEEYVIRSAQWRMLGHPNVLPFYGILIRPYMGKERIGLVTMWADNDTVISYLHERPESDRRRIILEVTRGLAYLHRRTVVHGNFRGQNVLIDADGRAVITDWRLPFIFQSDDEPLLDPMHDEQANTIPWLAPELLGEKQVPTYASDVFSLARTILEIMTGERLFKGWSTWELARRLDEGRLWPERPEGEMFVERGLTDELWELMTDMWDNGPELRPTIVMVVHRLEQMA